MSGTVRLLSAVLSAVITLGLYTAAPVSAVTESKLNTNAQASFAENSGSGAFNYNADLLGAVSENISDTYNADGDKEEAVGAAGTSLWNCTATYNGTYVYTGSEIIPQEIKVSLRGKELTEGTDYTLSFNNNTDVGTAKMIITGIGAYIGSTVREYTIEPKDITSLSVTLKNNTFIYDGKPHNAGVTINYGKIELVEGMDYTLVYEDNVKIGTATVTVIGTGNYFGQISKTYVIGRLKSFSDCTVTLGASSYTYSGAEKKPSVTVKDGSKLLTNGVDYTLTYSDNINAGTASVSVRGRGIYSGTISKSFTITPKLLYSGAASLTTTRVEYDGKNMPEVVVKDGTSVLKNGTDYTVSYSNNTRVGAVACATVTLTGNYSGRFLKSYEIIEKPIEKCTFSFSTITAEQGKLNEIKPIVKNGSLLLKEGTDYRLSYSTDNSGTIGYVNVQGIGNYSSVYKAEIKIAAASISNAKVSVNKASACLYSDGVIRSLIIVKYSGKTLCYNKDYTLSFKTSGSYVTVTVKGIGNYSGTYIYSYTEILDSRNIGDRFVWGRDNWSFDNSRLIFSSGQVNDKIKSNLMSEFKMNDDDEAAVNDFLEANEGFNGSCYGMTVSSILSKLGYLNFTPYSVTENNKGTDICNFVQSMYIGTRFSELTRKATLSGHPLEKVESKDYTQMDYIDKLHLALRNNDTVVSLIYRIEIENSDESVSHCVVAYGVENCAYTYFFKDGSSKTYNKRILVYDPNFGSSNTITDIACIYFNSKDKSWLCPEWTGRTFGERPVTCYWNSSMGNKLDCGSISSIIKFHSISCSEDLMSGLKYDYAVSDFKEESVGSDESTKITSNFSWALKPDDENEANNELDDRLIRMGDIDFDESVSIEDATLIQNYLCEMTEFSLKQLRAADLDGDGDVTVSDVAMLQLYLAELIPDLVLN